MLARADWAGSAGIGVGAGAVGVTGRAAAGRVERDVPTTALTTHSTTRKPTTRPAASSAAERSRSERGGAEAGCGGATAALDGVTVAVPAVGGTHCGAAGGTGLATVGRAAGSANRPGIGRA